MDNIKKKPKQKQNEFVRLIKAIPSADFLLTIFVVILAIFGLIMIFSASYYDSISNDEKFYTFFTKHLIFLILGGVIMYMLSIINCDIYKKLAPTIYAVSLLLFILMYYGGLGKEVNGSVRWLVIGPITIMPGEIAKLAIIIFSAWFLARRNDLVNLFTRGLLPLSALCGIIIGLVAKENMSTAITLIMIFGCILIVAGLEKKYMIGILIIAIAGTGLMLLNGESYRWDRILSFTDPFAYRQDQGLQVVQGLIALGTGGLFGVGLGDSVQKTSYLPYPHNDFILAIIGEELGFIGIASLMLLYCLIVWRCIKIGMETEDLYSKLLVAGITGMIASQVVLNIAVVTSSIPPTGVILPLVSYGGNATWIFMASFGIILNISRRNKK